MFLKNFGWLPKEVAYSAILGPDSRLDYVYPKSVKASSHGGARAVFVEKCTPQPIGSRRMPGIVHE
jgi:hypothetical protein